MLQTAAKSKKQLYAILCVAYLVHDLPTLAYIANNFASKLHKEDVAYINTLVAQHAHAVH